MSEAVSCRIKIVSLFKKISWKYKTNEIVVGKRILFKQKRPRGIPWERLN